MASEYGNITEATTRNQSLSDYPEDKLFQAAYLCYLWTALIIGLPGNVLIATVYIVVKQKRTSDWFIFFLSVYDCAVCVFAVPLYLSIETGAWMDTGSDLACKIEQFTIFSAQFSSVSMLGIIAVDRYLKICHPTRRSLNATQARNLGICTPFFSALVAAPILVWDGNVERRYCRIQEQYKHTIGVRIHLCSTFGYFVCMFFMVIFCYIHVCVVVRRRLRRHRENALKRKHLMQIPAFLQAISNVDDPLDQQAGHNQRNKKRFSLFSIGSNRRLSAISPWVKARLSLPSDNCARKLAHPSNQIEVSSKESLADIKRQLDRALMFRAKSATIEETPCTSSEYFHKIDIPRKHTTVVDIEKPKITNEDILPENKNSSPKILLQTDPTRSCQETSENINSLEQINLVMERYSSGNNDNIETSGSNHGDIKAFTDTVTKSSLVTTTQIVDTTTSTSPHAKTNHQTSQEDILNSREQNDRFNYNPLSTLLADGERYSFRKQKVPEMKRHRSSPNISTSFNGKYILEENVKSLGYKNVICRENFTTEIPSSTECMHKSDKCVQHENCTMKASDKPRHDHEISEMESSGSENVHKHTTTNSSVKNKILNATWRFIHKKCLMKKIASAPYLFPSNFVHSSNTADHDLLLCHAVSDLNISQNNDSVRPKMHPSKIKCNKWNVSSLRSGIHYPGLASKFSYSGKILSEPYFQQTDEECTSLCLKSVNTYPCSKSIEEISTASKLTETCSRGETIIASKSREEASSADVQGQSVRHAQDHERYLLDDVCDDDDNNGKKALLSMPCKHRFSTLCKKCKAFEPTIDDNVASFWRKHRRTRTRRSNSESEVNNEENWTKKRDRKERQDLLFLFVKDRFTVKGKNSQDLDIPLLGSSPAIAFEFGKRNYKHSVGAATGRPRRPKFDKMKRLFPRSASTEVLNSSQASERFTRYDVHKDSQRAAAENFSLGRCAESVIINSVNTVQGHVNEWMVAGELNNENSYCVFDKGQDGTNAGRQVENITNGSEKTRNIRGGISSPLEHVDFTPYSTELMSQEPENRPGINLCTFSLTHSEDNLSYLEENQCNDATEERESIKHLSSHFADKRASVLPTQARTYHNARFSHVTRSQSHAKLWILASVTGSEKLHRSASYPTLHHVSNECTDENPISLCSTNDVTIKAPLSPRSALTSSSCLSERKSGTAIEQQSSYISLSNNGYHNSEIHNYKSPSPPASVLNTESVAEHDWLVCDIGRCACEQLGMITHSLNMWEDTQCKQELPPAFRDRRDLPAEETDRTKLSVNDKAISEAGNYQNSWSQPGYCDELVAGTNNDNKAASGRCAETTTHEPNVRSGAVITNYNNSPAEEMRDFSSSVISADSGPRNTTAKMESKVLEGDNKAKVPFLSGRNDQETRTDSTIWDRLGDEINATASFTKQNEELMGCMCSEFQEYLYLHGPNNDLESESEHFLYNTETCLPFLSFCRNSFSCSSSLSHGNGNYDYISLLAQNSPGGDNNLSMPSDVILTFDSIFCDEVFLLSLSESLPTESIILIEHILSLINRIKLTSLLSSGVLTQSIVSGQCSTNLCTSRNRWTKMSFKITVLISLPHSHSSEFLRKHLIWSTSFDTCNQPKGQCSPYRSSCSEYLLSYSFLLVIPFHWIHSLQSADIFSSDFTHAVSALCLHLLTPEQFEINFLSASRTNLCNYSPFKCDLVVANLNTTLAERLCRGGNYSTLFHQDSISSACLLCCKPVQQFSFAVNFESNTEITQFLPVVTNYLQKLFIGIRSDLGMCKSKNDAEFVDPSYSVCSGRNFENLLSSLHLYVDLSKSYNSIIQMKYRKCLAIHNYLEVSGGCYQQLYQPSSKIDDKANLAGDIKPSAALRFDYNEPKRDSGVEINRDRHFYKTLRVHSEPRESSNQTTYSSQADVVETSAPKINEESVTLLCLDRDNENKLWRERSSQDDSRRSLRDENKMNKDLRHSRETQKNIVNLQENKQETSSITEISGDTCYHTSEEPQNGSSQQCASTSEDSLLQKKTQKERELPSSSSSVKYSLASSLPFFISSGGQRLLAMSTAPGVILPNTRDTSDIIKSASNNTDFIINETHANECIDTNADLQNNVSNPIETTKAIHSTLLGCLPTFHVEEVHQKPTLGPMNVANNDTCEFFVRTVFDAFFASKSNPFKSDPCLSDRDYANSELIEFPISPLFRKTGPSKEEDFQSKNESKIFHIVNHNREKLDSNFDIFDGRVRKITSPTRNGSTQSWFSLDDLSGKPGSSRHASMIFLNTLRRQLNNILSPKSIRQLFGVDVPPEGRKLGRRAPPVRDTLSANQINVIITRCESLVMDKRQEMGLPPIRDRAATLDPASLAKPGRISADSTIFSSDPDHIETNKPKPRTSSLDTSYSSNSRSDDPSMICRSQDLSIGRSRGASLDLLSPASASIRTGSMCSGLSSMSKLTECSAYTENSRSDCEKITRRTAEREHNITKLLGVITLMFVISWSVSWSVILIDVFAVVPVADMLSTNVTLSIARNLFLVNHFCNVLVYAVLSKSFREKLSHCYKSVVNLCSS